MKPARIIDGGFFPVPGKTLRDYSVGIIVDNFAGGGGASTGIEAGSGRDVDVAINHDDEAIAMHTANHPRTRHYCQSIWSIDPLEAVTIDGVPQPVWIIWFSPDCTHHSNARGGKPREKNIRDLAWVVHHWIDRLGPALRPAIIKIENVEEFLTWGPLDENGKRIMDRNGEEFDRWVSGLRKRGYKVEWKVLRACNYGAPTIRKRLVLQARCDGKPIVWPAETHGPGQARAYRTAAECIDWSLPCPSIFLTKEEGAAIGVKRPLAEATMARIARGIKRYVLDAAQPFIVNLTHHGGDRTESIHEPMRTVTAARRGEKALIVPVISYAQQGGANRDPRDPMHTVCASTKDQNCLIVPTLVQTGYGERDGQAPRSLDIHEPLGTAVAGGVKHALVAAFLAQFNNDRGVVPNAGHDVRKPISTIATKGPHQGVVAAHLMTMRNAGKPFNGADEPTHTITAAGAHLNLVSAFLIKYYGTDQDPRLEDPLHTISTKDRFGLVTVMIGGEEYAIVDIGMRMLTPRELFAAQGFPADYIIDPIGPNGKPLTKTAQIRMCGNSVCPPLAEALVRATIEADEAEAVAA